MFVAARIDDMLKVPASWKDQASTEPVFASLEKSRLEEEYPSQSSAVMVVTNSISQAWKEIRTARLLADKAEISDEDKAKLRSLMWALEQFDIR